MWGTRHETKQTITFTFLIRSDSSISAFCCAISDLTSEYVSLIMAKSMFCSWKKWKRCLKNLHKSKSYSARGLHVQTYTFVLCLFFQRGQEKKVPYLKSTKCLRYWNTMIFSFYSELLVINLTGEFASKEGSHLHTVVLIKCVLPAEGPTCTQNICEFT